MVRKQIMKKDRRTQIMLEESDQIKIHQDTKEEIRGISGIEDGIMIIIEMDGTGINHNSEKVVVIGKMKVIGKMIRKKRKQKNDDAMFVIRRGIHG